MGLLSIAILLVSVPLLVVGWFVFVVVRFMVETFLSDPTVTFEFARRTEDKAINPNLLLETHRFRTSDGAELTGTLICDPSTVDGCCEAQGAAPKRPPRGIVLFSPEFGGDQTTWSRYAWFLPEAGYWLFTYDFRGTGQSQAFGDYVPRKWSSEREVADLKAALDHVRGLAEPQKLKIFLFGISRGGLTSLVVAASNAACQGVILEGSGSTLDVIYTYSRKWSKVYAPEWFCNAIPSLVYRAIAHLVLKISERRVGYRFVVFEKIQAALSGGSCLFIHGDRDRHVAPDMARRAFDSYPGPKELWMVPGARHNEAILTDPEGYRRRVLTHLACLDGSGHIELQPEPEARSANA